VADDGTTRWSRMREVAALGAIAFVITIIIAAPVLRAPSERLFGAEIVGRHHDPFTVMQQFAGAPVPAPFLQPATDWLGRALAHVVSPVAAYNVLVLWTFPLSAIFAYLFAYELTRHVATSAFAALAFAFAPFHVAQSAYHVHVAQTQWIPLYFLVLWRCLHGITALRAAALVAATAAVVLSNDYGGFIALTLTPVTLLVFWLAPSREERARSWRDLAWTGGLLATLIVGALLTARRVVPAVFEHPETFAFSRANLLQFSAQWWSYLVPPVVHPVLGAWSRRVWEAHGIGPGLLEQQVYLGAGVVALGAAALWTGVRARGRRLSSVAPFLAVIAAAAWLCSLSPEGRIPGTSIGRPSAGLYLVAPMFRVYARFGVVVQLLAAIIAAIGMTALWQRRTRAARAAAVVLLLVTVFEYAPLPGPWRDVLPTSAHRWLAERRIAPRVFDCTEWVPAETSTAWLGGYPVGYLQPALPGCGEPDLAAQLRALGFTHVIVRAERPEFSWLNDHARDGLRRSHLAGDAAVFEVTSVHPEVYVASAEGLYRREYNRAWTWRWASGPATLQIENVGAAARTLALDVELASFGVDRHVVVSLNGGRVTDLVVRSARAPYRIGPLPLLPGRNLLTLRPVEPPIVAASLERNNDARPLAIALGDWQWRVP
jgi:hypothetical protein